LDFFFPSDCRLPKAIVTLFKMTNNNYHPEASIRYVECSQILTQSNEEDGLIFCIHNGKHRLDANTTELQWVPKFFNKV
ncbi:unnamed protein product, partial [Rotaria sordida]